MVKKNYIPYNAYFFIPFLVWLAAGSISLWTTSQHDLFFAVNSRHSDVCDVLMYYFTWLGQAELIIPALLLLMLARQYRNIWYFVTALSCNLIPFLVQHFLKTWYNAPRPLLVYAHTGDVHYLARWQYLLHTSFPSGHSQGAGSFFCFLSLLLPKKYRAYGLLFFFVTMLVCYSRLYLAAHFFADVYAGSAIGVILTTLTFAILDRNKERFLKTKNTSS